MSDELSVTNVTVMHLNTISVTTIYLMGCLLGVDDQDHLLSTCFEVIHGVLPSSQVV